MLRRFLLPGLVALVIGFMYIIANSTPLESWYTAQDALDKALILLLGAVYLGAQMLPYAVGALAVIGASFLITFVAQILIANRRWPTLIPLLILLGANCIIFSAPGLVFSPGIGEPVRECELYFNSQNGVRVIRYPVDIRTDYGEQQFFLLTNDGGETWSQFIQSFVYNPVRRGCENIEEDDDTIIITVEESDVPGELQLIEYVSRDGGQTWQRQ